MATWIDNLNQERCDEIEDLTYEQLRCGGGVGGSRHVFDKGMAKSEPAKHFANAVAVKETCGCGRWRRRTVHARTHELLTVSYGGGVILTGPFTAREVFWAYLNATLKRQGVALTSVKL
jgi:hypothetical protein